MLNKEGQAKKAIAKGGRAKSSTSMPSQAAASVVDDIPVALRDAPEVSPQSVPHPDSNGWWMVAAATVVGLSAIATTFWFAFPEQRLALLSGFQGTDTSAAPDTSVTDNTEPIAEEPDPTLLGHFPYEEAPEEELAPVTEDGNILLREAAAEKFLDMQEAARQDGVYLIALSGFRTLEDQEHLFFEVKAERGQVATKRAEVSAPPGYSEHHTGYALDIGDRNVPAADINPRFENTAAFRWLEDNAARFQFELSFPEGNTQGVSYEPWHWRFVGDRHSLETFYKARSRSEAFPKPSPSGTSTDDAFDDSFSDDTSPSEQ